MDSSALQQLLKRSDIWRASETDQHTPQVNNLDSGYPILNSLLPGHGWPSQGLTEILYHQQGVGEISLLIPALKKLSQQDRWIAWIDPPFIPYAPALVDNGVNLSQILIIHTQNKRDSLWAAETLLASNTASAALYWPGKVNNKIIRRLQLAASKGNCWGLLFRSSNAALETSPAPLRIQLKAMRNGLVFQILKRPGGWPTKAHFIAINRKHIYSSAQFTTLSSINSINQHNGKNNAISQQNPLPYNPAQQILQY